MNYFQYIGMVLGLCLAQMAFSQSLDKKISVHYQQVALKYVLQDLQQTHKVSLAYSSDRLPMEKKVSLTAHQQPVKGILTELFKNTNITFQAVGNQIVLRPLASTEKNSVTTYNTELTPKPQPKSTYKMATLDSLSLLPNLEMQAFAQDTSVVPNLPQLRTVDTSRSYIVIHKRAKVARDIKIYTSSLKDRIDSSRIGFQMTFVPPLSTGGKYVSKNTYHVSVNLLGGVTGNVHGLETGMIANVTGNLIGVQAAGMVNVTRGKVQGFQFSGFTNVSKDTIIGGQFGGFANVANQSLTGTQGAGFINVTKKTVKGAQLSGFMNVAKKVRGAQIGVINIADSVQGVQIGVLSFSRKGYRRIELFYQDAFDANIAFKMGGSKYFYNIFSASLKTAEYPLNPEKYTYALGYGLGTEYRLLGKLGMNFELMTSQVNENETWTPTLNMLHQGKLSFVWHVGKEHTAIFAGANFNVYTSQLYHNQGNYYGSKLSPEYVHYSKIHYNSSGNGTLVQLWTGFQAGIRF